MSNTAKSIIGISAILGSLMAVSPAAAQGGVQCGGLDATIVVPPDVNGFDGTEGDDVIVVAYSPDIAVLVNGLGGDDTICVVGTPTLVTDAYQISISGGVGNDTLYGGDGDDHLSAGSVGFDTDPNTVHGGLGDDFIVGGDFDDELFGNQGDDIIAGRAGDDAIHGGQGNDLIGAQDGDDQAFGGPGNDAIYGGIGKDELFGGGGHDALFSHHGLDGQIEFDSFLGIGALSTTIELDTAGSRMFGGTGNDVIIGSNRWDRMQGGDGNDVLMGLEGRDWMRGGAGSDIIIGGAGIDDVNGNLGNDHMLIHGQDTGLGGFGTDICHLGNGSNDSQLRSCETEQALTPAWNDISDQFTDIWEWDIITRR